MAGGRGGGFETTRWTLVITAGGPTDGPSHEALGELCQIYWPPLYGFLRRRGYSREDAQDLTQGFFARFLERKDYRSADPERGRFRGFLLTALRRYVINEHERCTAARRGGPVPPLALDFDDAERTWLLGIRSDDTPERVFDRGWAALTLNRAIARLRAEYDTSGKAAVADALLPCLTDDQARSYRDTADLLGMTEGAVRVAVHRLRRRFGEILWRQVADTVSSPDEVDDEMRELLRVVGS
jgi:RNA polymerase sigma-70 factor (ECF subfamily)